MVPQTSSGSASLSLHWITRKQRRLCKLRNIIDGFIRDGRRETDVSTRCRDPEAQMFRNTAPKRDTKHLCHVTKTIRSIGGVSQVFGGVAYLPILRLIDRVGNQSHKELTHLHFVGFCERRDIVICIV